MRDILLLGHIVIGFALIAFSLLILLYLRKHPPWLRWLSLLPAALSWFLLFPAGKLYLMFYPATKTLIKAGAWPWTHSIIMETKEHWGLLLPLIITVATGLIFTKQYEESRKWWWLTIILTFLLGIFGRIVKIGALA